MSDKQIPKITIGYKNKKGQYLKDLRVIAFQEGQLFGNLGTLVAQSNQNSFNQRGYEVDPDAGVYIYQTKNPKIAYRIYKCFADYGFNGYGDDILIQKLIDRSKNIKLTKFPTGIITHNDRIIGQEIPFFEGHYTLFDTIINSHKEKHLKYYKSILKIIKELYDNGIIYCDLHSNNFMVNPQKDKVEIIDFELLNMKFDDKSKKTRIELLSAYKNMISRLNNMLGIDELKIKTDDFEEMNEELSKVYKK